MALRSLLTNGVMSTAAALLALSAWTLNANERPLVPDELAGVVKVDAEGVIELIERVPHITIIDARMADDRLHGYLEGSYSLPDVKTDCQSLAAVVANPAAPVLFYCNGVHCGRSVNAIRIAARCGYTDLYWFRGGFEEWKEKNYPYLKH